MKKEQIAETLEEVVTEQLQTTSDFYNSNMDGNWIDDYGADSIDMIELIMAIDEEFDLAISDDEAEKYMTPNQALEALVKELA